MYLSFDFIDSLRMHKADKKLLYDIAQYGWHVVKVFEGEDQPGFAYSVGLYQTFKHPEILIIGLKPEPAHVLINNIGDAVKNGKEFQPEHFYSNILDDFKCFMVNVQKEYYEKYLGYALWYYKSDNFPLLQCIYPTLTGVYPWEKEWPEEIDDIQPILGEMKQIKRYTITLYRPVGPEELELIKQSGWKSFPPRLEHQPIFYPVMNEEYAIRIARDWNVPASGSGYVTKFEVDKQYASKFKVQNVGGPMLDELWVPAEELEEFNRHIVGLIEVTREFHSAA